MIVCYTRLTINTNPLILSRMNCVIKWEGKYTKCEWFASFVFRFVLFFRQQTSTNTYVPHNKEWLKEKIYGMLKKQANKR